jgi:hypothetical protein
VREAGPVRTRRPVYTDLLLPCNAACPAGENIQAYLASTRAGEHERAWRQLTADNPFPAIHGRVCYHPCENSCNRAELIEASEDADLLIVGSRGAGGFTRLMMGSVSSQVSHHAHCPVVIVPGNRR